MNNNVNVDQQTDQKIQIELNVNEVNIVLAALRELPYRVVSDLLNKVISQATNQVKSN